MLSETVGHKPAALYSRLLSMMTTIQTDFNRSNSSETCDRNNARENPIHPCPSITHTQGLGLRSAIPKSDNSNKTNNENSSNHNKNLAPRMGLANGWLMVCQWHMVDDWFILSPPISQSLTNNSIINQY